MTEENDLGSVLKVYSHCLRCGRRLKNPEAMKKGYGTICEKRMKRLNGKRLFQVCIREHTDWKGNPL